MQGLVFQESPIIEIGTNLFKNTPVILQYDDMPMIEVVTHVGAGYEIKIPVFHQDGTKLAVVKGAQLYLTADGKKAGVELLHPAGKTVCQFGDRTVFEIAREEAAALRTVAELYTPDGAFLKCTNVSFGGHVLGKDQKPLTLGRMAVQNMIFEGMAIGIRVMRNGSIRITGGKLTGREGDGRIGPVGG